MKPINKSFGFIYIFEIVNKHNKIESDYFSSAIFSITNQIQTNRGIVVNLKVINPDVPTEVKVKHRLTEKLKNILQQIKLNVSERIGEIRDETN